MNYTTSYNLPQWEDSDQITRADFNDAMQRIDAALAAQCRVETLVDYTLQNDQVEFGVALYSVDFPQYQRVDLCLECPLTDRGVRIDMQFNGAGRYEIINADGSLTTTKAAVIFNAPPSSFIGSGGLHNAVVLFSPPVEGAFIRTIYAANNGVITTHSYVKWENFNSLFFSGYYGSDYTTTAAIPAGTRVRISGIRK